MKIKTKESSIENVKRLFSNTSEDSTSIHEAYAAWGRDLEKVEDNKSWLSNLLTHLKYHNLVVPVYAFKSGHRMLDGLRLTIEGKKALGRIEDSAIGSMGNSSTPEGSSSNSTLTDVMKTIAKLRRQYPEFQITFDIKLKEV
jgi:hypothetical protein